MGGVIVTRQAVVDCITHRLRPDKTQVALCRELFNRLTFGVDPGARAFCHACGQFGLLEDDGFITVSREPPPRPAPVIAAPRPKRRRERPLDNTKASIFQHPDFRRG